MFSTIFGFAAVLAVALADSHFDDGDVVPVEYRPYHVSVRLDGKHVCSGAILSKSYVLTALSCVEYPLRKSYSIKAGSNFTFGTYGQIRNVVKTEKPLDPTFIDLAALKLDKPLVFEVPVKPVKRPTSDYEVNYSSLAAVTGWPRESPISSIYLHEVSLRFITNGKCQELYGPSRPISSKHICTDRKGFVELEVGSPLVDESGVLVGIVRGDHVGTNAQDPFVFEYAPHSASWLKYYGRN